MKYLISFLPLYFFSLNAFALGINMKEPKTIKSDMIEYNVKTEEIKTSGNTEMTNISGQRVRVNNVTLSKNQTNVNAEDIELWLGSHVYLRAKTITRDGDITTVKDAEFTACDGCDDYGNAWEIFGKTVIHDSNEKTSTIFSGLTF